MIQTAAYERVEGDSGILLLGERAFRSEKARHADGITFMAERESRLREVARPSGVEVAA